MTDLDQTSRGIGRKSRFDPSSSKQRVWLQIYLPLIIGITVIVILAIVLTLTGAGDASVWADISIAVISLPIFVLSLLFLAVLIGAVYALIRLRAFLLIPLQWYREIVDQAGEVIAIMADRSVQPILIVNGLTSVCEAIWKRWKNIFTRSEGL